MIIETAAVGPFFKTGFVLGCERTGEAVFVDPGDEVQALLDVAVQRGLTIGHIPLTHAHVDHVSGCAAARRALGAPIYLHEADNPIYRDAVRYGRVFGLTVEEPPPVDVFYTRDTVITFGDYTMRPHHTPGHCPGGVCLEVRKAGSDECHLFVGDTLFAGSIGRTDLPGGDYDVLMSSITGVLFSFGDGAIVYPGHGPNTTIGDERRTNPFLNR